MSALGLPLRAAPVAAGVVACLAASVASSAWAQQAEPVGAVLMDTALQARFDPIRLPGGERLGLLSASWLLQHDGWWWGPTVSAAATGHRGGLFVLGGQVARRWAWRSDGPGVAIADDSDWLETSLVLGGGGGAAAPVGGGLMVLPALTWMHDWGGWQSGLSWSQVSFPSGAIRSRQLGLVLQWDGSWRRWPVSDLGQPAAWGQGLLERRAGPSQPGVLGWQRVQVQAGWLYPRGETTQGPRVGMIGALAEHDRGDDLSWTLESHAAAHGGADGYMEILGGAAWRLGLDRLVADGPDARRGPSLGLRAAVGLGGGGAVPTGGGLLAKAGVQGRWPLGWTWPWAAGAYLQLDAGGVVGQERHRARYLMAGLGWDWTAALQGQPGRVQGWRASASWQRQTSAARKSGQAAALDTIGFKLQPDDGAGCAPQVQAHSAYGGGAGAYSLGLVGLGCATAPGPWQIGAEASVGAAGGGGVATYGGAVAQAQVWLAAEVSDTSSVQVGLGRLRSLKPGTDAVPALDTPVVDVSWRWRFGQVGR